MKQAWKIKKMGDVLLIERGGSPRPISKFITNSPNGINWIKISDATASGKYIYKTKEKITRDGLHKTRVVNEGDFILSNSMSFGRPYIMKTTGCIHDGWLVLKQNGKKFFESEFLYYLLSSPYVFQQFNNLAAGSTVRNLNIALVSSVQVPIPPIPEQKRIVGILDKTFAAIDQAKANAQKNLQNSRELFESYLNKVFSNPGEDWEEKKLGEVSIIEKVKYRRNGLPYVGLEDIESHSGKFLGSLEPRTVKSDTFYFSTNHILYGRLRPYLNKVLIPNFYGHCSTEIFPIRVNENIDKKYLAYWFSLGKTVDKINATSTGARMPRANMNSILDFEVPIPIIDKQKKIVKELDILSKKTKRIGAIYRQKLADFEELKKSILQKAFEGEL